MGTIVRVMFDDHDSFYEIDDSTIKKVLDADPSDRHDIVISDGESTSISSTSDVDLILPEDGVFDDDLLEQWKSNLEE